MKVGKNGALSGLLGNTVLRDYNGITVASVRPTEVRNPRTQAQQAHRMRMRNIINIYAPLKPALKDNFQGKVGHQSDYTRFQGCNISRPPVFLNYREADNNGCVVAPYMVSFGTLATIGYHWEDGWLVTDIDANGVELTYDMMTLFLAVPLIQRNPELFKHGDTLELIACFQRSKGNAWVDQLPYVECKYTEFSMGWNDRSPLGPKLNGFELKVNENGKLCIRMEGACALAVVRKRGEGRDAMTSIQMLEVDNPILATYSTDDKMQEAIASYSKRK